MRTLKWINGNSTTHSHSLDWLLLKFYNTHEIQVALLQYYLMRVPKYLFNDYLWLWLHSLLWNQNGAHKLVFMSMCLLHGCVWGVYDTHPWSVDNSTYTQPDVDADFTGSGNSYLNCGRMHVKSEAQTEIESKYIFMW